MYAPNTNNALRLNVTDYQIFAYIPHFVDTQLLKHVPINLEYNFLGLYLVLKEFK